VAIWPQTGGTEAVRCIPSFDETHWSRHRVSNPRPCLDIPLVLARGIKDMVRISDARMSGTAYGAVVLHVCPEAAAGGTLALVQDGDIIETRVEA
jgi:hypothetical protein